MAHTSNSPAGQILPDLETVSLERDGHILLIGLNRPQKRNSFDRQMLADLSRAYALLEADTSVRAGVVFAHGDHFTAGLDLADADRASPRQRGRRRGRAVVHRATRRRLPGSLALDGRPT
jgi:enoyl-CoA hydratase/carnithine racemase